MLIFVKLMERVDLTSHPMPIRYLTYFLFPKIFLSLTLKQVKVISVTTSKCSAEVTQNMRLVIFEAVMNDTRYLYRQVSCWPTLECIMHIFTSCRQMCKQCKFSD